MRVVVVGRPPRQSTTASTRPKAFERLKPLVAFFSTEVALSAHAIVETYADRWTLAIDIRDGHAYYGVAQDQGRKCERIVGANTLRLLLAAARTLWCIAASSRLAWRCSGCGRGPVTR